MLTVMTPAASTALTTLEAVKSALDVTDGGLDGFLSDLIDRASASVAGWCNRVFAREAVTETFRLTVPTDVLVLSRWPVVSVSAVTVDSTGLSPSRWEVDPAYGDLYRLDGRDGRQMWTAGKVVVAYTAGFALPGEDGRSLPADIEDATIALVRLGFHRRGADPLLKSVALGETKLDYYTSPLGAETGLPIEVAGLLSRYRCPVMG